MKQSLSIPIPGPIGVFDSGYGGLTILSKIREALPEYDYIYLGDNARAPYGTRSFESYTSSHTGCEQIVRDGLPPGDSCLQHSISQSTAQHTDERPSAY